MATLCVRLKDNLRLNHPAPYTAARPGDIVDVLEDGVDPGRKIRQSVDWLLIRLPGVPAAKLKALREPESVDLSDSFVIQTKFRKSMFALAALSVTQLEKRDLTYNEARDDFLRDDFLDHVINKTTRKTLRQDRVKL